MQTGLARLGSRGNSLNSNGAPDQSGLNLSMYKCISPASRASIETLTQKKSL